MKKLLILTALVMMSGVAHAAEQAAVQPDGLFEYDFRCEFQRDSGPEFKALARVFAESNDVDEIKSTTRGNLLNLIAVSVDDHLIAANSAILNSGERFVVITDANGSPSIVVKREHIRVNPQWMKFRAWLVFGDDHRIPGECQVRAEHVHGHEVLQ